MFHAFKQRMSAKDDVETDKHTRFKRTHLRGAPVPENDCGIDPYENLSRMTAHHSRSPSYVQQDRNPAPQTVSLAPVDLRASLHSSEPITISVLHNALPLRAAEALSRK